MMSEHKINDNVTLVYDESGNFEPENMSVFVGTKLYDWKNAPKESLMEIVESDIIGDLKAGYEPEDVKAEIVEHKNESLPALPPAQGIGGIVRPAVSAMEALAAWKEFQALKSMILERSDLQRIGNRDFVKKSGWRKFATFYNLTDRIVEETQEKN